MAEPRVWVLDAYRAGERTQLRALATALGWPFEIKRLGYRRFGLASALLLRNDLKGIDPAASDPLGPPWPDLVLSVGMRNEPVARWIRDRSGGRTKLVFLGRQWADPRHFDLIITTPQYPVPDRPNVLRNALPLHGVTRARLDEAAALWAPRLAHLPRPYLTLNIGGTSGPYAFGPHAARRLLRDTLALARARGGSLLVSSSARTPSDALDAFAAQTEVPMQLYRWRRDDPDNPYLGFLALADEVIVTADSISMLAEAASTGKPLHMFDISAGRHAMRHDMHLAAGDRAAARALVRNDPDRPDHGPGALAYRALMRWGWSYLSRDISRLHLALIRSGRARWLGDPAPPVQDGTAPDDMARALDAIRALIPRG
ncbi:MAG: mitochondrial fission ELM1 family protein [Roseovarius sp.]|nr:mitochondrial fission ELM1 family protein [Roseovarius sp.]